MPTMEFRKVTFMWMVVSFLQFKALVISIIGYAGNYIVTATAGGDWGHTGLWSSCTLLETFCFDTVQLAELKGGSRVWVDVSRAMMSITIICQLSVILMTSMAVFREPTKVMGWITAGIAGFSAVVGLVGLCVVAGKGISLMQLMLPSFKFSLGWSFGLFLFGQFTFIFASVWHFLDARNTF